MENHAPHETWSKPFQEIVQLLELGVGYQIMIFFFMLYLIIDFLFFFYDPLKLT